MSLNETFRRATSFLPNTLASLSVPQIVEVILSRRRQSVWNWGIIYRAKVQLLTPKSEKWSRYFRRSDRPAFFELENIGMIQAATRGMLRVAQVFKRHERIPHEGSWP